MTWWQTVPGGLALTVLLVLPGWAALWAAGVRGTAGARIGALGGAPAVTCGIVGALGIVYAALGVPWTLLSCVVGAMVAVAIAGLVGRAVTGEGPGVALRSWRAGAPRGARAVAARRVRCERALVLAALLGAGLVLARALAAGMGQPGQPAQTWDAVFHLNAAWTVRATGDASMLGGLAPMYGGDTGQYYPTVWHALVAITPFLPGIAEAGNVSTLVLGAVLWPAGLVALARACRPDDRLPAVFAPVLAVCFVAFPTTVLTILGTWPFALTVAAMPGALAMIVATLRTAPGRRTRLPFVAGSLAVAAGLAAAHGSAVFSLGVLAVTPVLVAVARRLRRLRDEGHPRAAAVLAVLVPTVLLALLALVLTVPVVREVFAYPRRGAETYGPVALSLLVDEPLTYHFTPRSSGVIVVLMALLGAVIVLVRRRARWLVGAAALTAGLTLLAAGPETNPLRVLAGPWFTQAARLHALAVIPAVMLASATAAWVARGLQRGIARLATRTARRDGQQVRAAAGLAGVAVVLAVVAVGTSGLRWPTHTQIAATTYRLWPIAYGTMLEPDETELIDRVGEELPADAVVLGDPAAGTPYLLHRAGVRVVLPQLSPIPASEAAMVLAERFELWRDDPSVCAAVRELGVTHVYADEQTAQLGRKSSRTAPGLRHMRPQGDDFRYVDGNGNASIWRFTGCDQ